MAYTAEACNSFGPGSLRYFFSMWNDGRARGDPVEDSKAARRFWERLLGSTLAMR